MTTIKDLFEQLETTKHPVAKALHKGTNFKTLAIGFKKGMILKDHKAPLPSKLFVISGKVISIEGDSRKTLDIYEETIIPVNVIHAVEALEDSLCLLTQG